MLSDGQGFGWISSGFYVKAWYCYRGADTIRIIGGMKVKLERRVVDIAACG